MDAVELNYPVAVAVPAAAVMSETVQKIMGSEVCGGGRDSVMVVEACNSLLSEKDATSSLNDSDSTPLDKVPARKPCQPSFSGEGSSKQPHFSGAKVPSWIPSHEELQVQRKVGQVLRSGSGCSKRPRMTLLEDTTGPAVIDNTKEMSSKLGSQPTKSDINEKTHSTKQRNNFSSRRGDRRNFKVSTKNKYDSFSVKASLASFSSAAAGNNFFGLYGVKTDVHDSTKLVDDISLNDLLQGTYECSKIGKDKGKKATNNTENILHSVRKACSILQPPRSTQFQNFAEIDSCSNEKMPTCQPSSVSIVGNGDHGDSSMTDLSTSDKDFSSKPEASANFLNLSFEQPKETLERLALPPPKDLESLLLDAAKPAVSSRNASDPRPGKQACRRPSLSPFPWSHTFNGNCRNNSDATKLLTSRSTCQGRWVKVGNGFDSLGTASKCLTDLESLTYDDTLVPSCGPKLTVLENNISSPTFVPQCNWGSLGSVTSMTTQASLSSTLVNESGDDLRGHAKVEQCPRLLAAAQTLYDISTSVLRLNKDSINKWPKKPSQKVMKARKSKSTEKPENILSSSTSIMGSGQTARISMEHTLTSKRPKLSTESKKDLLHMNGVRKGQINWSTPKSSRSSPNKSVRESTAYLVKPSCTMPPSAKVVNRACNGQQKFRKLMRMDWNR